MEFYEALHDYAQTVGAGLTQHVLMYLDELFFMRVIFLISDLICVRSETHPPQPKQQRGLPNVPKVLFGHNSLPHRFVKTCMYVFLFVLLLRR